LEQLAHRANDREILIRSGKLLEIFSEINQLNTLQLSIGDEAWKSIAEPMKAMVRRHEEMKKEADKVNIQDHYLYIHQYSLLGKIVCYAETILQLDHSLNRD
jgi:hypothetical protein